MFELVRAEAAEPCGAPDEAAFELDEALVVDEFVTDDCVFCAEADALGVAEFCACASNWYAKLVNAVGL